MAKDKKGKKVKNNLRLQRKPKDEYEEVFGEKMFEKLKELTTILDRQRKNNKDITRIQIYTELDQLDGNIVLDLGLTLRGETLTYNLSEQELKYNGELELTKQDKEVVRETNKLYIDYIIHNYYETQEVRTLLETKTPIHNNEFDLHLRLRYEENEETEEDINLKN